jgi:hypothetical protein
MHCIIHAGSCTQHRRRSLLQQGSDLQLQVISQAALRAAATTAIQRTVNSRAQQVGQGVLLVAQQHEFSMTVRQHGQQQDSSKSAEQRGPMIQLHLRSDSAPVSLWELHWGCAAEQLTSHIGFLTADLLACTQVCLGMLNWAATATAAMPTCAATLTSTLPLSLPRQPSTLHTRYHREL